MIIAPDCNFWMTVKNWLRNTDALMKNKFHNNDMKKWLCKQLQQNLTLAQDLILDVHCQSKAFKSLCNDIDAHVAQF